MVPTSPVDTYEHLQGSLFLTQDEHDWYSAGRYNLWPRQTRPLAKVIEDTNVNNKTKDKAFMKTLLNTKFAPKIHPHGW